METNNNYVVLEDLIPKVYREIVAELLYTDEIDEAALSGGRGSVKSTVAALMTILAIVEGNGDSAICFRRHANGLRDSVYNDCLQAIERLGLNNYFIAKLSPLKLVYIPNGGTILFRGMDDHQKVKGIKLKQGQFCFAWFEELQEVEDSAKLRSIIQTVARGTRKTKIVYTFNPPVSANHWVNVEMKSSYRVKRLHTTYLQVPKKWLGEIFIKLANTLKINNELAYRNEYLGEPVGAEGMVFQNVKVLKNIDRNKFEILYRGVDFGFASDPACYVVWGYNKKEHSITALYEFYGKGISDDTLAYEIKKENKHNFSFRCDNSEPKSISKLVSLGLSGAVACTKGADSVRFGLKWLQGLVSIYIDPEITPNIYNEFTKYEYIKRNGVATGEYYGKNNHTIDASRYALEPLMLE